MQMILTETVMIVPKVVVRICFMAHDTHTHTHTHAHTHTHTHTHTHIHTHTYY
jgi:hypothetical protein